MKAPIAVALDAPKLADVATLAMQLAPHVDTLKIGLETYLRDGSSAIDYVTQSGCNLFLDLKLHDIPNTVAGACKSVSKYSPKYLTVHASGGFEMIKAAVEALPETRITAVTILTSLTSADLEAIGFGKDAQAASIKLAMLAVDAGARAIVCSPQEVAAIRAVVPADITLITPGVRPVGAALADQNRVATPRAAIAAGADLLVIGRPITQAQDPEAAAAEIALDLAKS
jgi:orotidine-5'-phosphate decarboxylase